MTRGRRLARPTRALLAVAAAASAVLAAPSPSAARPAHGVALAHSSIHWRSCDDPQLQASGAQCAMVTVPLNYARRGGRTISLAVARVRHTVPAAQFQGVLLTNPGGPGGAGRYLATMGAAVPNGAGAAYDWIGIDPRGVGASRPAVSCEPRYFRLARPDYRPGNPATVRAWLARSKAYAAACARRNGALLDHLTTVDSARDLDRVRIALGARQISYYGYSYGTYLGQVYATLFPARVRRMVLDSNVDPRRVWYGANLDQDRAFQRNIDTWFRWVAGHNRSFHLGATAHAVATSWYRVRDRLAMHPDHRLGPDEWTDAFLDAAYYQQSWSELGWLFAGYVNHDDVTAVKEAYLTASGDGDDNQFAMYNAVQCTDVQWPKRWATWQRDNIRTDRAAPFETWANAWFNAPCLYWPAAAHRAARVDGRAVRSALLVGETRDAATPFSGSLEVRRRFPGARLIALPGGTSHANSLNGDRCLDGRIAAYLATGTLPKRRTGNRADATCAPLPPPVP